MVCVPFREGTNRGVGVLNDPLCGSNLVRFMLRNWCSNSAAMVRAFTHHTLWFGGLCLVS
jgi:hypothetical protein